MSSATRESALPVVLAAVLVATLSTAAWIKWRRPRSRPNAVVATSMQGGGVAPDGGVAVNPPLDVPSLPVAHGARMLHGDPRHTHRAAGRAPRTQPRVVWSHAVGGPVEAQVVTSPDDQTLYAATLGGKLVALARADGAVRWTFDLGDRAYATPCVADDGTIYAGSDAKKLVALSPEGRTRWTFDAEDEVDTGCILAKDGTVIFAAGPRAYGLTAQGYVKWRFKAKRKVYTSPAVAADGRTFLGSQDHHVYALTPQGGPLWSVDLGADVDGAPVVGDDGALFVGTDGNEVARLDPSDGHVLWRAKVGGYVRGTLSMTRRGEVVAGVYGPAPRQVLLAPETGDVRFAFSIQGTGAREFGIHGGALEDDSGLLLFGAQDDAVYAVDPAAPTGEPLWRYPSGADVDSPVTLLDDGSIVFGSDDGAVTLLRGD